MGVAPSEKVTVPVGVPVPGGAAVAAAVRVTESPNVEGFRLDASDVVLGNSTTCDSAAEELAAKVASPL
jgi:hypothetical protein